MKTPGTTLDAAEDRDGHRRRERALRPVPVQALREASLHLDTLDLPRQGSGVSGVDRAGRVRLGPSAPAGGPSPVSEKPTQTPPELPRVAPQPQSVAEGAWRGAAERQVAAPGEVTIPPVLRSVAERSDLAWRISQVRGGKPGLRRGERPAVRALLEGLERAQLGALRDMLALRPPHPQIAKMRGHPALKGPPTVDGVLALLAGEPLGVAETRAAPPRSVTNLERASPSKDLFPPGTEVRVPRSNGQVEAGWVVRSRAPDGDLIVAQPDAGAFKKLSPSLLFRHNPERLAPGTEVQIRRSQGELQGGWTVTRPAENGEVWIAHPSGAEKRVSLEHLLGVNAPLLAPARVQGLAGRIFAPGREVTVERSSGALEPGWQTLGYNPAKGEVAVVSGNMRKLVPARALLEQNPGLLPSGTPVIMPRTNGLHEDGWAVLGASRSGVTALGPSGERKQVPLPELLDLNPQLFESDPPALRSGGPARASGAGLRASEAFNQAHLIPAGQTVPDGYVDGGRSARFDPEGVRASREVIVVDREQDPELRAQIAFARSLRDVPEPARAVALLEHVANLFEPPGQDDPVSASERLATRFRSAATYLGEVPDLEGGGACRHRALMLKVLGDAAGLSVSLQRGNADFGAAGSGGHAWNVIEVEGRPHLADPMNPTRRNGAARLVPVDDPAVRRAYLDVNWKPLYGGTA